MESSIDGASQGLQVNEFVQGNLYLEDVINLFFAMGPLFVLHVRVMGNFSNRQVCSNGLFRMRAVMEGAGLVSGPKAFSELHRVSIRHCGLVAIIHRIRRQHPIGIQANGISNARFGFRSLIIRPTSVHRMVRRANNDASESVMGRVFNVTIMVFRTRGSAISGDRIRASVRVMVLFPLRAKVNLNEFVQAYNSRVILSMAMRPRVSVGDSQLVAISAVKDASFRVVRCQLRDIRGELITRVPRAKGEPRVAPPTFKDGAKAAIAAMATHGMMAIIVVVVRAKRMEGRPMYLHEEDGAFRRDHVVQFRRRV